ncbi:ATP-binding cassette domain-containing protein [Kitasatospora sp. NPDC058218]|uniref:ATP-binding cassette domain-containing protein n=1 Tax=Kitasatospora sp. NPDC058218 TaxID=3346385 RepID=UPI0036DA5702
MSAPVTGARPGSASAGAAWAIEAEGLGKTFGGRSVVDGVDLAVAPGTVFGLLGPNGAGKTTTVRMLTTLLVPDRGRAAVAGFDVVREATEVRRRIGLTGQLSAVDERLTGRENLVLVGRLHHLGRAGAAKAADELLERFGLAEAGRRPSGTYSGGMRRRLDLAASLIADPPVLFLDEPTTGLDLGSRLILWQTVREQVTSGTTVLLTTQYLEEADRLADRIAVVDDGTVIAEGTPEELKRKVGGERLELAFATVDEADRAQAALGADLPRTPDRLGLHLPVEAGPRTVAEVAGTLADLGLRPEDFAVRKPSLDDVFLALTGRSTTS